MLTTVESGPWFPFRTTLLVTFETLMLVTLTLRMLLAAVFRKSLLCPSMESTDH